MAKNYLYGLSIGAPGHTAGGGTSALAVLDTFCERAAADIGDAQSPIADYKLYRLVHLERFTPDTSIPEICNRIRAIDGQIHQRHAQEVEANMPKSAIKGYLNINSFVMLDATGIGLPGIRAVRDQGILPYIVTLTHAVYPHKQGSGAYTVPVRDVGTTLKLCLEGDRLLVAAGLSLAETLIGELIHYTPNRRPTSDELATREAPTDDLLRAVGVAVWVGENALIAA